jgi:hypothetical protein
VTRARAAAGQIKLRHALVAATLTAAVAVGVGTWRPAQATVSGNTYTWNGASGGDHLWSTSANWTCTVNAGGGACPSGTNPIADPNSDVVFPAAITGLSTDSILDAAASAASLTLDNDYSLSGTGTTLTAGSLSDPANTLVLSGAAPSGVTLVAPVKANSTSVSVQSVVVNAGNSLQTSTPGGCGPTNTQFCVNFLSLAGNGPASGSSPGALVATNTINVNTLAVAASSSIQTNSHTVDFGILGNDPVATLATKGTGALEFGISFNLHNLDFNIASGGALNYVGTVNTVTLGSGASLGNKQVDSNIAARGAVTLAGDAAVELADGNTLETLTLNGTPQLIDNGHTFTLSGASGGELVMDGANQSTGAIAVQPGATLHASGTLHDVHVAGTGDPLATPAAALHLDGSLALNALVLDGNATVDVPAADTLTSAHAHAPSTATLTLLHDGPAVLGTGDSSGFNVIQTLGGVVTASGQLGTVTLNNGGNVAAFLTVPDGGTLHVANLALDSAGNVDGNGSVLVVDGNLTDNGTSQILAVNGHGSGVTLQGDHFNNTTDMVNVASGSFLSSGGTRLHDVHIKDAPGSTCPVDGNGCAFTVTGSLTLDDLVLSGDSGIDVKPGKALTITQLSDAAFPMQLTLWDTGTTTVTNSVALSNLKLDVAQSGTFGAAGTLNSVNLSTGSLLVATSGNLTVSSVLAESAASPTPATNTVMLGGGGRTITLSNGISGSQVTELLSGVTVIADGLSGNATKVDSGGTLKTSGTLSTLQIAGKGPSGSGNALILDGTLTVTNLSLTGDADANLGAFTLTATNLLNPSTPATLTAHGSGLFTVTNSTTRGYLNLAMPDTSGLKFIAQGSVHDVTVCPTCSSVVGSPALRLGAPSGTTLSIDGTLALGNPATDEGAYMLIPSGLDVSGAGGTVSVTGPGGFIPNGSTILLDGRLTLNQVTSPNPRARIQVTANPGGVLTATGSLSQVIITGNGSGSGALIVPPGAHDLTIALFDGALGNSTINVAAGRTLTISQAFQAVGGSPPTVLLTGAGTTVLTDPQLPPQGARPALFEVAIGATLAATCSSGTCHIDDTTLDAGGTLLNSGPSPLEVAGLTLSGSGAPPVITGNATTVILDSLTDGPEFLQIGTGAEPNGNGVSVVADNLSLNQLGIIVKDGSTLTGNGTIGATLDLAGHGVPSGIRDALIVDGILNAGNVSLLSDAAILTMAGDTLNVSNLSTNGHALTLDGPGSFASSATDNLPTTTFYVLEVGGGVILNGPTFTLNELILHGGARVQPTAIDFGTSTPLVKLESTGVDGPAQLGAGDGSTGIALPQAGTLEFLVADPGSWAIVPAVIGQNGPGAAVTVDGTLGTVQLNGDNTYTGATKVAASTTLLVDGSQPSSDVSLLGGTLGGHGKVGAISGGGGGTAAPDNGSTLTAANPVNLSGSNDVFQVTVGSGAGSSLKALLGAVVANPPAGSPTSQGHLQVLTSGTAAPSSTFDILQSPTPTGAFAGLPDGAELVTTDNQRFQIHYNGGTGHDVVLTALGPAATSVAVTADNNPQVAGQPVQLLATLSNVDPNFTGPINGLVTFFDGATQIGQSTISGNLASLATSTLPGGANHITAQYGGDSTHLGSTSPDYVEIINLVPTSLNLDSSPLNTAGHHAVPSGTPITFTALLLTGSGTPTGSVTYYDGLTTIGNSPLVNGVATLTTATLPIGLHEITAAYNGDAIHAPSTSGVLTQHVTAPTTTTLSVPQTTVPAGTSVTITVHVASATPGTITGTVTCADLTTPSLDPSGNATCTTGPLSPGSHTYDLAYNGDDGYTPSNSADLKIYTLAQSVTLSTSAPASTDGISTDFVSPSGTPITFSSLVAGNAAPPTGTVTFYDGGSSIGSDSLAPDAGNTALGTLTTMLTPGLHVITAHYGGDGNNGGGTSNTVDQFVTLPTTTTFTISQNPVVRSNVPSLVFTAHLTTGAASPAPIPAGTVTFTDLGNSVLLGSAPLQSDGSATLTGVLASNVIIGAQNIVATYAGDNAWSPSTAPQQSETVLIPTTTAVASSANPVNQHRILTFTVTVGSGSGTPTGSVTLLDGATPLGSSPLTSGHATFVIAPLAPGVHAISAAYSPTGLFGPSTGGLTQTVVPPGQGYWLVGSDGGIFPFGSAQGLGSAGGIHLNQPIVGMASTPDGHGYWLVAADGGIFPFGNAGGFGSTGGIHLNRPIVGMASTPTGNGYWLVASDGGIFPFGDAGGYGSTGAVRLNQPIVGMASTPSGHGYWLVASDGGIFPFGDAAGLGSTGGIHLNQPIVGMAVTPTGNGYWLVASDGGIFPFGDAPGLGSTGAVRLNRPIVGMASTPDGGGYWLVASDGGIFPFGDAVGLGSTGGIRLNSPIVGMGAPLNGYAVLPG